MDALPEISGNPASDLTSAYPAVILGTMSKSA